MLITRQNQKRPVPILVLGLVVTFIAFALSFGVAIYVWLPVMQWNIKFRISLPFPPSITGANTEIVKYESPYEIGPELWNCWISDYTVDPATGNRLRALCKEAHVAKILMFPTVVLLGILVVGVGLMCGSCQRVPSPKTRTFKVDAEEISI